jgi:hypothetical protein
MTRSLDGSRIVFTAGPLGGRHPALDVINADGSGQTLLVSGRGTGNPSWQPRR